MEKYNLVQGVMPAILSVYDEERNVIKDTVKKMVNYHLDNGMTGFYVGGNTGECTILPNKTRKQMLEVVKEANAGRGKIIVHVGAGHIDDVYDLIDHANEVGVDAIASLPPSLMAYYKMDEIIEYYRILAKRSKAPVLAYVTGVLQGDILGFVGKLTEIDNIIGVKMSIPDYFMFGKITAAYGDKFSIYNGPDECMICGLSVGAEGAIGSTYNMLPKLSASIYDAFKAGDMKKALEAQRKMNAVINILIQKNAYWKGTMSLLGYDMGSYVEPRKTLDEEGLKELKAKLDEVGFFDLV